MRIIAYFTASYREYAMRLAESLNRLKYPYYMMEYPEFPDWVRNNHLKTDFIRDMLNKFKEPVLYVDADAVVHKPPVLLEGLTDTDIGVYFLRGWKPEPMALAGTIYAGNTIAARRFLEKWIEENHSNTQKYDDANLRTVLKRMSGEIKVMELPVEYCTIFDRPDRANIDPVIEHFQASRKLRKIKKS